jgi:molybdopterin-synthase adenylyltransferase
MTDGDRYARQRRLPMIGSDGQHRIRRAHVLLVGCGALGSACAELLVRAGVGTLTIVDRDVVEWTNLQRQFLFDEEDARRSAPKVEAAQARLHRINRETTVRAHFDDFGPRNAERYGEGVDVILDGLDNLETRYLLNDLAVKRGLPYVYGAAVGTVGMTAVIRPAGEGASRCPCLRCIVPEPAPAGSLETCETAGVLGSVTTMVAAIEVAQAIKLIVGATQALDRGLLSIDLWRNEWRRVDLTDAADPACPCCGERRFEFLEGDRMPRASVLCGRNAVQILPAAGSATIDLATLALRWDGQGPVRRDEHSIMCELASPRAADGRAIEIRVFANGRMLISGTTDPEFARSLVARFVGA